MYSMDKYGKLKRQIDRYFLPFQINPNLIIDALKQEEKKNSPPKLKKQTLTKINEEINRFQMLKITGKEFQSKFTPSKPSEKPKTRMFARQKNSISHSREKTYQLKKILNEPLESIFQRIKKDPQSYLYLRQLNELEDLKKYRNTHNSEQQLSSYKDLNYEPSTDRNYEDDFDMDHYERIIKSNPILHQKIICAYQDEKAKVMKESLHKRSPLKKDQVFDSIRCRRTTTTFKTPLNEKTLSPHEMKKMTTFIQYRQFLLTVNISNQIMIYPQNQALSKAFVCKGNNGILVKSILKTRPWWCIRSYSDIDNCYFVWTEWKRTKMMNDQPVAQIQQQSIELEKSKNNLSKQLKRSFGGTKVEQLKKIISLQNFKGLQKYILDDQEPTYYSFTRRINEKRFEQANKKMINASHLVVRSYSLDKNKVVLLNHVPGCLHLHSKKLMYKNLRKYYERDGGNVDQIHPLTFLISEGLEDNAFAKFTQYWEYLESSKNTSKSKNIWICKPGENSNRGNGIIVLSTLDEIKQQIRNRNPTQNRTIIIQKYLEHPYLFNRRKFDIRCFILITCVNGINKGYWYSDGYLRTTSKQYNLRNLENRLIHLTNDAIQKKGEEYGKFESCNKVSFADFEKYLEGSSQEEVDKFNNYTKSQMKEIAKILIESVGEKINPARKQFCFELFGLDFILDQNLQPYLIEANSNPCLEVDGLVLGKIIPSLLENTIKIAVDPLFPPPYSQNPKTTKYSTSNPFETNKFQLIYNSLNFSKHTVKEEAISDEEAVEEEQHLFDNELDVQ